MKGGILNLEEKLAKNKNDDFLEYIKSYSNVRKVPLSRHKLKSVFQTSRTSLDIITQNDVVRWLNNPSKFSVNLIRASRTFYKTSGEYRSLLNYFIDMARFYHVFDPIVTNNAKLSKTKAKKDLAVLSNALDKMNIKHELSKVIHTCIIEDVFFGYEVEDKNNYFLLKLEPEFCRINGMADGMYTFEFNLGFFEGNEHLLKTYPEEFQRAYVQSQIKGLKWFEPDFTKTVCFKFNENTTDIIPPFSMMFEPLLELNDYKKLKKVGAKINNYMLLHQKVPMHDNKNNDNQEDNFAISTDSMDFFNEMVNESLPDEIGAIVSPMEINPIQLDKDDKTDKVLEATRDVFNSSGVSSFLFNNDKNSTGGLSYSVKKDELLIINFYRQVERWLNRKIRYGSILAKNQWRVSLLNVTGMSEDKYLEELTKSGSLGFAVRGRIAAMHGLDYHTLSTALELENDILDLDTKMIPLASTHTGGLNVAAENTNSDSSTKGGRPTKESDDLSDSGQSNRDAGAKSATSKGGEN